MAIRTNAVDVQSVLMADYGPLPDGSMPSLIGVIEEANLLTTQVRAYAITYRGVTLGTATLEMIERLLAAHNYAMSDQPMSSRSGGGASGSFQGQTTMGLKGTKYGQRAITTDYTRTLSAMDEGRIASTKWIGKPLTDALTFDERN